MKKVLLIIIILLTSGCYDYVELNDLSFISAIGLDYNENKEYEIIYEILNDTKNGETQANQKAYTVSSKGKTIAEAFDNLSLKVNKIPYYFHFKALVISENVAKFHMKEVIDYVLRNTEIRNEFFFVISKDNPPKDIIAKTTDFNPVVGDQIVQMIKSPSFQYNVAYNKPFEDTIECFINERTDAIANVFTVSGNTIGLTGLGIFDDYVFKEFLSKKDSSIYNLLNGDKNSMLITHNYDNLPLSIKIYFSKVEYEFKNNKINISIKAEGEIKENLPDFDLKYENTYIKLEKDFKEILENDVTDFLKILKDNNSDILGLEDKYYKKTRKTINNIMDVFNIEVKIDLKVNKKGLVFGVNYE